MLKERRSLSGAWGSAPHHEIARRRLTCSTTIRKTRQPHVRLRTGWSVIVTMTSFDRQTDREGKEPCAT